MKNKFTLTDSQKEWIKKNAEELEYDVKSITISITGDKGKDGRSLEGMAVKKFLSEDLNVKPQVRSVNSAEYEAFQLTDKQKEFLRFNFEKMSTTELALELFEELRDIELRRVAFSRPGVAIARFLNEIGASANKQGKQAKFQNPDSVSSALMIINKFTGAKLEEKKLKDHQIESIEGLCVNLKRVGVRHTMENFKEEIERERFLESFICDTWDKEDLTSGEISQYIDLAGERVHLDQIKNHQMELKEMMEVSMRNDDKIQYTLVESIDKQIQNRDKCMGRIEKLQKSLEGTRTQRLKDKSPDNVTILSIIEKFMKEKERKQILKMQKRKDEVLSKDIDSLDDMDEYVSRILGITKSVIINQ